MKATNHSKGFFGSKQKSERQKEKLEYIKNYAEKFRVNNLKLDNFIKKSKTDTSEISKDLNLFKNQNFFKILKDNDLREKLMNLLTIFSKLKCTELIESKSAIKESVSVQTEVKKLTVDFYENENLSLEKQVLELKKKNEILKLESENKIENLNLKLSKYEKENFEEKYNLLLKEHEYIDNKLEEIKQRYVKLESELAGKNEYIKNLEESIRLSNEEKQYDLDEEERYLAYLEMSKNVLHKLADKNLLSSITSYLEPEETFNLKHTDRELYLYIDSNPLIQKQILITSLEKKRRLIEEYSRKDLELSEYDESISKNLPIASLITKYNPLYEERNPSSDRNRKELGNTIFKAIDYLNIEIGYYLNIQNENIKNSQNYGIYTNGTTSSYSSNASKTPHSTNKNLLGSFGGYMNKFVSNILKPVESHQNLNSNHESSARSTKNNTESRENSAVIATIESQFLNFDKKECNFNYSSPLEVKNLLYSCFFRLGEMNNMNNLKSFVEEVSYGYAKLLFFSIEIMRELCETRVVKNSLYEFVTNLKEEKRMLMKDNNQIMKELNSLTYFNSLLKDQRDQLRQELEEITVENKNLILNEEKISLELKKICEKYKNLEYDYFEVKSFFMKENINLRSDLQSIIKERDEAMEVLKKIKIFFNS
jgi:hypothetical protein